MTISLKILPSGTYAVLIDESAGDALESFGGALSALLQETPLARAAAKARFARGNAASKIRLRWHSSYATAAAAFSAVVTNAGRKGVLVDLKFVEGGSGGTTAYIHNAIADSYEYLQEGRAVSHALNFTGDDLSSS